MDFKEIERFAAEVRAALSHLSVEQIAHLTEGLEANVKASVDDGRELPDVETYVKELLSGAGLDLEESAGTRSVVRWIRAFINPLVKWFRGLNGQIRLLIGVVAFFALTILTTDHWTIAVVIVVVILIAVSRVPQSEDHRQNKSIIAGLVISCAVVGWALVSGVDQNSDPFTNVKTYCPSDSNLEQRIALPTKDVPNLVGKTWGVAAAQARLWWSGGVELDPINPEVFEGTGGPMMEGFIVGQQGDPVLFHTICNSTVLIPIVLVPRSSTVTTLTPKELPGDTTTSVAPSVAPSVDNGGSSSTTSSSAPKSAIPSKSTTTTTRP